MSQKQGLDLLIARNDQVDRDDGRFKYSEMLSRFGKKSLPLLIIAIMVFAGYWIGINIPDIPPDTPFKEAPKVIVPPGETQTKQDEQKKSQDPKVKEPSVQDKAIFRPGQEAKTPYWVAFWPLFLLAFAGIIIFLRHPDVVLTDSPEFTTALSTWHPLVMAKQNTPRALKRYLNRVRYVAMYIRGGTGELTRWKRLISWFRRDGSGQKTENIAQNNSLHESLLVGMAAIHHVNPAWLDDDRLFDELSQNRNDLPEAIHNAIDIHNQRFQNWPPKKEERDLFKKISAGIYVS
jgi:hypothetical protein